MLKIFKSKSTKIREFIKEQLSGKHIIYKISISDDKCMKCGKKYTLSTVQGVYRSDRFREIVNFDRIIIYPTSFEAYCEENNITKMKDIKRLLKKELDVMINELEKGRMPENHVLK